MPKVKLDEVLKNVKPWAGSYGTQMAQITTKKKNCK